MPYGKLNCQVVEATNLPDKDWFSKNDPYCIVTLSGSNQSFKTKPRSNSGANAMWEAAHEFNVIDGNNSLTLQVFDKDTFTSDDLIGSGTLELQHAFDTDGPCDRWCSLKDKKLRPAGEVRFVLTFHPTGGRQQQNVAAVGGGKYTHPGWGQVKASMHANTAVSQHSHAQQYNAPPPGYQPGPPAYQPSPPPPSAPGLPPGWQALYDPSGKPYYVSPQGQTQWHPPSASSAPPPPAPAAHPPSSGLPPGWEEHRDPSGKPYYVNTQTKATQWDRPSAYPSAPAPPSAPPPPAGLPAGWTEERDASGRSYYVNHATRATQWDRPTY